LERATKQIEADIAMEQENETKIIAHTSVLNERSNELTTQIRRLEDKQRKVSEFYLTRQLTEKLHEFVEENERIRMELFYRDKQALLVTDKNNVLLRKREESPRRRSPLRQK
jgi:hypothetical protein